MNSKVFSALLLVALIWNWKIINAQEEIPVTTAVPFLVIPTNATTNGMGQITVVSNSLAYYPHFTANPSLLAGKTKGFGTHVSYTPWLRNLISGVKLVEHNIFFNINEHDAISYSFRHFRLGPTQFTNIQGENTGIFFPKEFAIQLRYSRLLGKHFALGVGFKYIHSNLARGQTINGVEIKLGRSYAGDIGFDYRDEFSFKKKSVTDKLNVGLSIQNLGSKITYTESAEKDFIPTILNIGIMNSIVKEFEVSGAEFLGERNVLLSFSIGYQLDKLLVPTPSPEDNDNNGIYDYREKPLMSGIFGSFADAPSGAKGELHELLHHAGISIESIFFKYFFIQANVGTFLEHENKGNRKLLIWSVGGGFFGFRVDFALNHGLGSRPQALNKNYSLTIGYSMVLGENKIPRFIK